MSCVLSFSKLVVQSLPFAQFCEVNQQVNSVVAKLLKLILCSSHDRIPLNYKKNLSGNIDHVCEMFEPSFHSY
jgi:hypothetical protein